MTCLTRDLQQAIGRTAGVTLDIGHAYKIDGGSINTCWRVATHAGHPLFLKLNERDCAEMFAAEFEGLAELRAAGDVRVPEPIAHGVADESAWLLMEHLELEPGSPAAAARLGGRSPSSIVTSANASAGIGTTPSAAPSSAMSAKPTGSGFFRTYRLGFQLGLAVENGGGTELQEKGVRLLESLPRFFTDYSPAPSLLHGDLWGGNWAMTGDGEPVIFDPAVYYGDREADIAMTELFGGFPREFYVAYEAAWPLDPGYRRRQDIYNLYHVLNHLNLFGGGLSAPGDRADGPAAERADAMERPEDGTMP